MSVITAEKIDFLEKICEKIKRDLPCVRFIGVINPMGHRIAGSFRDSVSPFVDSDQEHMMYMQLILDLKMRQEFDSVLGQIQYIHSQRDNVSMISVPLGDYIILVSTEIGDEACQVASRIKSEFLGLQFFK